MTTTEQTTRAAEQYFTRWQDRDFDGMAELLADDVDFVGALGAARGITDCMAGLRGVRGMVDQIAVLRRWVDGADAITWFELRRTGQAPISTVNWSHVDGDGLIDRIRVTFDPRPLLG